MPGRLGCLDTIEAIITDQCGGPRICSLTNVSAVSFNRILDDISQASVTIPVATGIGGTNPCCECMGLIEPWCHELHIIRNGEEVWTGPVTRVTYGFTEVVVEAADVLAWLLVRVPQGVLDNSKATTTVAAASNGVDISTFTAAAPGTLFVNDASNFNSVLGGTISIQRDQITNTTAAVDPSTLNGSGVLQVASTAGFTTSGSLTVGAFTLTYAGITTNTFTGVSASPVVTGSSIAASTQVLQTTERILTYKGVSGNSLTGVSTTATGTIATGDRVEGPSNGDEITDLALDILETGFNEHDPCVLEFVLQTDIANGERPTLFSDTTVSTETGFTAFDGTVYDWLTNLSELGLDFTTIGRRILLMADTNNDNRPRVGTLTDEHILGEIQVAKDGFNMSTRAFVRWQDDDVAAQCEANNPDIPAPPCPAVSEDIGTPFTDQRGHTKYNPCPGVVERVFTDALGLDHTTAKQTADAYVRNGAIAPRTVDFSSGARLSQDTPWEFNEMIPGQRVSVAFQGLCLDIFQDFRVQEVTYALQVGSDEEITLSLGVYNLIGNI